MRVTSWSPSVSDAVTSEDDPEMPREEPPRDDPDPTSESVSRDDAGAGDSAGEDAGEDGATELAFAGRPDARGIAGARLSTCVGASSAYCRARELGGSLNFAILFVPPLGKPALPSRF